MVRQASLILGASTEDQIASAAGQFAGTFTLSSSTSWSAAVATFVAASSTPGSDCWGQNYTYDRYANLTNVAVTKCTAPSLNLAVSTTSNRVTNTGYSYDASGNVTSDGALTYTWNAEGLLSSTAGVTYTYDGDNRRVKKSSGKLYWYGVGGAVLGESDINGNMTAEYIFFNGQRIARRDPATGNVFYFLADALASVGDAVPVAQHKSEELHSLHLRGQRLRVVDNSKRNERHSDS